MGFLAFTAIIFTAMITDANRKEILIYFKDPRTNQCFAAQTKEELPFKLCYLYKITAVNCENIPDSLIIKQLPK